MASNRDLYHAPATPTPTGEHLKSLSEELGLQCSEDELSAIHGHVKGITDGLTRLIQLKEPALPVKYPRVPGYRPAEDDNPLNGWYWRCDIKGDAKGKLTGKRIGIKDSIAVAGVPMAYGTALMEGYMPEFDATVVTRILDAGGNILGKTNVENQCISGSSHTSAFGPVRNPHDETRTAGGSSGGSAALVSAGHIDMALGGDQGGSIRIPAAWCGVVGLKPTFGLVPCTGAVSIETTLDHLGPITKTVEDNALLLEVIAGNDELRDPRQPRCMSVPEYTKHMNAGISGKRIGVLKEGFEVCVENDIKEIVRREVDRLKGAGAVVEEVSMPMHRDGSAIWSPICLQGTYNCMVKGNGTGTFWKGLYPVSLLEAAYRGNATRPQNMSLVMKTLVLVGEYLNRNYQNKFYAKAQNLSMALTAEYDRLLQKYDVLVMPTTPYKASKLPKANASPEELLALTLPMIPNTAPFDCTGHPALTGKCRVQRTTSGRHADRWTPF